MKKEIIASIVTSAVVGAIVSATLVGSYWTPERLANTIDTNLLISNIQKNQQAQYYNPAKAIPAIKANWALLQAAPTIGNPNAKVTVIEFMDYQCSACRGYEDQFKAYQEQHLKDMRFIFIPISIANPAQAPESRNAAITALWVFKHDPAAFAAVHSALFAAKTPGAGEFGQLSNTAIEQAISTQALTTPANVPTLLASPPAPEVAQFDGLMKFASEAGIMATPTVIIIPSDFDTLSDADQAKNIYIGNIPEAAGKAEALVTQLG